MASLARHRAAGRIPLHAGARHPRDTRGAGRVPRAARRRARAATSPPSSRAPRWRSACSRRAASSARWPGPRARADARAPPSCRCRDAASACTCDRFTTAAAARAAARPAARARAAARRARGARAAACGWRAGSDSGARRVATRRGFHHAALATVHEEGALDGIALLASPLERRDAPARGLRGRQRRARVPRRGRAPRGPSRREPALPRSRGPDRSAG